MTTTSDATTNSRDARTFLPEQARELLEFAHAINGIDIAAGTPGSARLVGPNGEQLAIPSELFQVLGEAARHLAFGSGVTIMPNTAKLTTQEAADFLGISRPTLVKLLESGAIEFETVGRHRRVTLRDVVSYQEQARAERRAALKALARDSVSADPVSGPSGLKRLSDMGG